MRTVVLMPSFGHCPFRTANEAYVVEHYRERWGLPVVVGTDAFRDGLYARTSAINAAARAAVEQHPDCDAFVLCDNDLIPDESTFAEALEAVRDHAAVTPHAQTQVLTRASRLHYLKTGRVGKHTVTESGSRSLVVLTRDTFAAVNGMDEAFRGWGPEDKAFLLSITKQVGPVLQLQGTRVHLWHPLDPSRFMPGPLRRNRERLKMYELASRPQAARLAREYGAWDAVPPPPAPERPPAPAAPPTRFDHEVGLKNVHDLLRVLADHGVRAWAQDGTLLGLIRDGRLIEWDHDTDTGAMMDDFTPDAVKALEDAGFTLKSTLGEPGNGLQHRWVRDGVKTDIFWYYRDGERWWHAAYVSQTKQYRYFYDPFPTRPLPTAFGSILVPDPPEDFLLAKYGPDWRTPRKRWHFATDPVNAIRMAP